MMAEDRECLHHSGVCARVETLERNEHILFDKLDKVTAKLNIIMGGVLLLWPAVQIVVYLMTGHELTGHK